MTRNRSGTGFGLTQDLCSVGFTPSPTLRAPSPDRRVGNQKEILSPRPQMGGEGAGGEGAVVAMMHISGIL